MSGIYIPGVEIPKDNTVLLRIYPESDGVFYVEQLDIDDDILDKYWAVPVPEHGRLIDADRLRHSHCAECTLYPDNCLGDECDWDSIFHIDHAPTIIPAEEDE